MPSVVPARSVSSPEASDGRASGDAEPPIGLAIDIVHEAGDWDPLERVREAVNRAAAALASELLLSRSEACVALSSDAQVAQLNATYRGKTGPTNVLSFPVGARANGDDAQTHFLGDLILAGETVKREAADLGLPFQHHVQHLIVHGLLHLLGYDHETDADAHAMEALEVRILARLGIANPYAKAEERPSPCRH